MRIAQVSPLYESVPPKLYGGTERVVFYLTEELVRLGHDVTLFASGDSRTAAHLVSPWERAVRFDRSRPDPLALHIRMLGWVYQRAHEFDVIHCHTDYLGLPLSRFASTPTLVTLHGRLDVPGLGPLYGEYPGVFLVSISDAQRKPLKNANWLATIYHGLPPDLYRFEATPGSYLLFLGRIAPEKCPDAAIRIACRAGVPLRIAAKIDDANREYYESHIRPLLDHPLVEFLGEVDDRRKGELLRGALAVLFPVDWPEPFGLVLIEALACGTPVIARCRGSVSEILRDGVTGFICESEEAMVRSVARVAGIQRLRCRAEFERRFTIEVMAQRYLQAYRALAGFRGIEPRAETGRTSVAMLRTVSSAALPAIEEETAIGASRVAPRAGEPVA